MLKKIWALESEVTSLKQQVAAQQAVIDRFLPLLEKLEQDGPSSPPPVAPSGLSHDKLKSGRSRGERCCDRTAHFRHIFSDPVERAKLVSLMQAIEARARGKHGNGAGEDDCWLADHATEDESHYVKCTGVYFQCPVTGQKM